MNTKPKYKTKNREELIAYLASVSGHFTAADIYDHFRANGSPIGQATVYRQLESLVDEGVINKYIIDGSSPACFEYVGHEGHADAEVCFHCKCEKCGRLIHLHCEELEEIQQHLYSEHHFRLDPLRTVFYGLCEDCSRSGSAEA